MRVEGLGELEEDIIEKAVRILREGPTCDNCLGRQFAKISSGLTNKRRGEILKNILREREEVEKIEEGRCWLCNNLFNKLENFALKALEKLKEYEFDSFLVGTKVSGMLSENEETMWEIVGASYAEPLKAELNREVGKIIESITKKGVDFDRQDILVILNLWNESVELQVNPVFIYGRYRKLEREIPQTKWMCRVCRGRGCKRCNFTGKRYEESVEELIKASILDEFAGEDMKFHGSGREDVDARVLGTGRPFVAEVREPKRRKVNLAMLEKKVREENKDKIEIIELRDVKRDMVAKIKNTEAEKTYKAKVRCRGKVTEGDIRNALAKFTGAEIEQRTPTRVLHRRADLVRKRRVYEMKLVYFEPDYFILEIRCEGGLYIKELISGDGGRTKPNLSEFLKMEAKVLELDVVNIDFYCKE